MRRREEWGWSNKKVRDILDDEIIEKFKETHTIVPTATEQNFRWPSRAVDWYIENEKTTRSWGQQRSFGTHLVS